MNEEDFELFLEDFCDFLNGLEASIVKMKMQISKLVGIAQEKPKATLPEELSTFSNGKTRRVHV